jgi:dienelactone hydrolase
VSEILLFHHICGLTPGVVAFADSLRAAGHTVHTPDLFGGRRFDSIEAGSAYVDDIGFDTVVANGVAAAADLPEAMVYAGFSLGVIPAQSLAQTRAAARGALFFEACAPHDAFGDGWPAGLPVQVHGMDGDPFFAGEGDIDAARELVELAQQSAAAELFVYHGDHHLFADSSLQSYDAAAAALLLDRVLKFLDVIG